MLFEGTRNEMYKQILDIELTPLRVQPPLLCKRNGNIHQIILENRHAQHDRT